MISRTAVIAGLALAIALGASARQRSTALLLRAQRDSAEVSYRRLMRSQRLTIQAGEIMPAIRMLTAAGDTVVPEQLIAHGMHVLYFYRDDCAACLTLGSLMDSLDASHTTRLARIHVDYRKQARAATGSHHFAWVPDSSARRVVATVPSVVVLTDDGRVRSSADFRTPAVIALLDLERIIPRARAESSFARARANSLATTAAEIP